MMGKLLRSQTGQATLEYLLRVRIGAVVGVVVFMGLARMVLGPAQGPTRDKGGAIEAICRPSHHTWNN